MVQFGAKTKTPWDVKALRLVDCLANQPNLKSCWRVVVVSYRPSTGCKPRVISFKFWWVIKVSKAEVLQWRAIAKILNGSFSGLSEEYSNWSLKFQAFAKTRRVCDTLTGNDLLANGLGQLSNDRINEKRAASDAAEAAYRRALDYIERKKHLWRYLAMLLDSASLILIRYDCLNNRGLSDGCKAWVLLQQKFRRHDTLQWSVECKNWFADNRRRIKRSIATSFVQKSCKQGLRTTGNTFLV